MKTDLKMQLTITDDKSIIESTILRWTKLAMVVIVRPEGQEVRVASDTSSRDKSAQHNHYYH